MYLQEEMNTWEEIDEHEVDCQSINGEKHAKIPMVLFIISRQPPDSTEHENLLEIRTSKWRGGLMMQTQIVRKERGRVENDSDRAFYTLDE